MHRSLRTVTCAAALAATGAAADTSELILSEYGEGSSVNKYIEIYNGTGAAVDLLGYAVWRVTNGGSWPEAVLELSGALGDGEVLVVHNPSADPTIAGAGDQQLSSSIMTHNGDDAVGLARDGSLIDAVGEDGLDPGTGWDVAGVTDATANHTLVRKQTVCAPNIDWDSSRGTSPADSEWVVLGIDDWSDIGVHATACGPPSDNPPTVASTTPADGDEGVALDVEVEVDFSEPVTVAEPWFTFECSASGSVAATVAGGPQRFTIDPDAPLAEGESCTVTVLASQVTDQDGPADPMPADVAVSFTTLTYTAARIHEIQGDGPEVTGPGPFLVEAIVIGDFQDPEQLDGFFIQEEDADADANPATSEALQVFCGSCPVDVAVGDLVRVRGAASDFFGMSQLTATGPDQVEIVSSGNALPSAALLDLPVPVSAPDLPGATAEIDAFYEAREGMLVRFADALTVAEYFQLPRFGQLRLAEGGRPRQFTDRAEPSEGGLVAHQIDLARRTVILDDDTNDQNPELGADPGGADDGVVFHPVPGFSATNFVRGGDVYEQLGGVLHWSFAGSSNTDAWRIRPVLEAFDYDPRPGSERTEAPDPVGGTLRVAALNVLNLFTTLDEPGATCGPLADGCRGAHSAAELERQVTKLVAAICGMDADVVGLMELENDAVTAGALADAASLVCGPYAHVATGVIGEDAIRVGMLYQPEAVAPLGAPAVLDDPSFTDPNQLGDPKNRPALAQSFTERATGESITVVVNHLKSKGSPCGPGDDDTTGGQGNCNLTRTLAAEREVEWLDSDPTGQGVANVLVIGDLNAYRNEDPIDAFAAGGYTDLIDAFLGADAYSFVFDGQIGYLDHALANGALAPRVTGVAAWHINADESGLLDYNDTVEDAAEAFFERKSTVLPLYEPSPYRASDHDPVVVGLDLGTPPPAAPECFDRRATIFVDADRIVVGGPQDGQRYRGILVGTPGADVMVGSDRRDVVFPLEGDDIVCALGGNDDVWDGQGRDVHDGGTGDDLLIGGSDGDALIGSLGDDRIVGGAGRDLLLGGWGFDRIDAADGETDSVNGGEGIDRCVVDVELPRSCEIIWRADEE